MTDSDNSKIAPMRVQVKIDDGTEAGLWVTAFEGWTDISGSIGAMEESTNLAQSIAQPPEGER